MSNFLKGSAIYFIANICSAATPFLLLPIFTRYLSQEQFGQIAIFQMLYTGLAAFIGVNSVGAASRRYYDADHNKLAEFNGQCFVILLFSIITILFVAIFFSLKLSQELNIPEYWVYAAIVVAITNFIILFRLGQWQIRSKAKQYGYLQVGNSFIGFIFTLLLLFTILPDGHSRVIALVSIGALVSSFCFISLRRDNLLKFSGINIQVIKDILNFGGPLIPHVFGMFIISSFDRVVINDNLGLDQVGIYALASQLSMGLLVVFDAINKAYVPWLFEKLKKNDHRDKIKIVKNTYLYFVLLITISGLGFLFGEFVVVLVGGEVYREAGKVFGWLFMGQVFIGMYLMVTNYIFYSKKTGSLALVTISSGVLNVFLLYILVPEYGLLGAAYAFVISMFIRFLVTWVVSIHVYSMPWLGRLRD